MRALLKEFSRVWFFWVSCVLPVSDHHWLYKQIFGSKGFLSKLLLLFSGWVVSDWDPMDCVSQASLSFTISGNVLKLMSSEMVMPSNHLISVVPFSSCLQSFLASGSFPMSQFFTSGGQNIGASASAVLPVNVQDCFPLGWTGWISLQSKGLLSLL